MTDLPSDFAGAVASLDSVRRYLFDLQNALAEADAFIAQHYVSIDNNPRSQWPKGSILEKALARHELRCLYEVGERAKAAAGRVTRDATVPHEQRTKPVTI